MAQSVSAQEEAARQGAMRLAALRTLCRSDVNTFIETVFRDDQTPGAPPFKQQWFHREWQTAWQTERISVIHGATGFGKTEQLLGYLLWRMGRDPSIRILIVGKSAEKAQDLTNKLIRQIENNKVLQWIFPELKPGKPWGSETARLATAGIDTTTNTLTVYGIATPKAGPRADIVVLDDVNDIENTRTEDRRNHVIATVDSVLQTRLTTNGQMIMLANAWHKEDLAFTYAKRGGVWYRAYPAIYPDGSLLWPSFRPLAWLKRVEASMHPLEFARMFLCRARADADAIFDVAWFNLCRALGAGKLPTLSIRHLFRRDGTLRDPTQIGMLTRLVDQRMRIAAGVDLATGKNTKRRKSDLTSIFVAGLAQDSRRHVLTIEQGRWPVTETLRRMTDLMGRFEPEMFLVEDNGTQDFFHQFAASIHPEMAIEPFTTTDEKWDPTLGIQGIGVELKAGKWVIPDPAPGWKLQGGRWVHRDPDDPPKGDPPSIAMSPEEKQATESIQLWEAHMLDFSISGHTSDLIMSGWFAHRGLLRLAGHSSVVRESPLHDFRAPTPFDDLVESIEDQDNIPVPDEILQRFGVARTR